ncbi:uncharacterized protein LOC141680031 [Apium graveolens]|uniref:uncharacterized protein LOC141680031 n=1 Tax=Apium graveolens TaxID=4045 RepID=UPI003D7910E2
MLEKTYSTFYANNMLLKLQYCERGFTKYYEIISVLLLTGQNNELLLKNHEARPTSSKPFPEVNVVTSNEYGINKPFGRGCGRGYGQCPGHNFGHDRGHKKISNFKKKPHHEKWRKNDEKSKDNVMVHIVESTYNRYRMKGHWGRTYRTSKHLVDLYHAFLKNVETNFTEQSDPFGIAHLEAHLGGADPVDPPSLTHIKIGNFMMGMKMTNIDDGYI